MKSNTILIGLNELNFEFINYYITQGLLPNFKTLFEIQPPIETISEDDYKLLEPWIQWVSIHTGKTFEEHQVFRLGDIVDRPEISQIFEELESKGYKVGAVSPFNAENRLKNPAFFVPDPWTKTSPSGNWVVKALAKAVSQSVNDNSQSKLNLKSILSIVLGVLVYVPIVRWFYYIKIFLKATKPGLKAVILDGLLSDVFIALWKKTTPDFSVLFLNSGAHIQHHYLFNSQAYQGEIKNPNWYCEKGFDPLIQVLKEYDITLGRLLKLQNIKIVIATGLHQQPHKHLTFYWRIRHLEKFSQMVGVKNFIQISPRMSRDFLIEFSNDSDSKIADELLNSYYAKSDDQKIFKIDNRGTSLFVELIYSNDISDVDAIYSKTTNQVLEGFKSYVSFVAIKNGEHNGIGYVTSNVNLKLKNQIPITQLYNIITDITVKKYFNNLKSK